MRPACKATLVLLTLVLGLGPATGQSQKWKFMVYGDTRGTSTSDQINAPILTELARATTNEKPAFVLVPGDLVNSGTLSAFQAWTNLMAPVYQAGIAVYPVIGNHDSADVNAYKAVFGPGIPNNGPAAEIDRTYSITYSNALVLNLDDYVTAGRVNQSWIDAVLATNTRPHIFAQGHMPAFKANHTDCLDDYPANRNAFWNGLSNVTCRIYFCGHDHFYNHARINDGDGNPENDVHQMIVGCGGAPFYTSYAYNGVNSPYTPTLVYQEMNNYGYEVVEIDGNRVTATFYHRTGANSYVATTDVFSYALPLPTILVSNSVNGLTLTWPTPRGGTLQSAPDVTGPYLDVPQAASPYVITNFSDGQQFYRLRAF
jgi:hypothetical protein